MMRTIPSLYTNLVILLWAIFASAEVFLPSAIQTSNNTAQVADPRSVGRVPPYHPTHTGVGPLGGSAGGFRPPNTFSRIEHWPHRTVFDKDSRVVSEDDNIDEDGGCHETCTSQQFSCQISCKCIPMEQRCDGVSDCDQAEDEAGCVRNCDESKNRTLCHTTGHCISINWICDGDNDCGDFTDETHCKGDMNCTSDEFQCANGLCIALSWVCDNENDCRDLSDEVNCTRGKCNKNQFSCSSGECVALHWKCDLANDCRDSSDESQCTMDMSRSQCGDNEYECENKRCITKDFFCDGDNDCSDWSDEITCPTIPGYCDSTQFKCNDGTCIPERFHCDTERDCAGGDDEINCDPHLIRNCTSDEYTCDDRKCILLTWRCDGVQDCSNGEDETKCEITCEEDQYMCKNQKLNDNTAFRNCVNRKHVCDGVNDCMRGDDEEKCPTKRHCNPEDRCEKTCITTSDGQPGCDCPIGYLLKSDGFGCRDIDECMYEQDPVCSQTCSNTIGSFKCGCMTGYVLRPDERSCKPIGDSPRLVFSNRRDIRQISLTGEGYESMVKGLHNAVALDYHYQKNLIFWAESSLKVIRGSYFHINNITDVVKWGLEMPGGIAVDWIHDLLFWTDSRTRRVEVGSLDGTKRAILASSDLDKPRAIAVHPGDVLVFWTDWGPNPKIERSDMDGSRRKSVIVDKIFWPNGLTIDYLESKIYWADAKHHVIEKATFDGRNRKMVIANGVPHPYALTLFEDAIYWTDWHTKSISTTNKHTGMGIQTIHADVNFPMDIHCYHSQRQITTYKNRCNDNNGGCSHLCLPNSDGYTCRCNVGFYLSDDGQTCIKTTDNLLLYARRKDLRLKQLNPRKQTETFDMVIPLGVVKSAVALDWDHNTETIFWTDVDKNTISRAYLNGSNEKVIIDSNLISPAGLAYDWMTEKLYWTDAGTNRIEVANVDGSMRALLAWENIDKPRDIVLDPKGGVMYWSDWGKNPCIERADMDGGNRHKIITTRLVWPNGLALDLPNNRIYWTDGGNQTIEYANLDGTGRTLLIGEHLPHPFGLDLYKDEVYWTDWETQSIQAANKFTGENRRTLGSGIADLMEVRVYHKERKRTVNSCSKNNGGCSHICLLKPKGRSCACLTGIKIGKDGRTCPYGPTKYIIFAHRVDIRVISLDVPYLTDVVLPLPKMKNALSVDVDHKTGLIYWTDTAEKKISRTDIYGKNIEVIINKELHTVDGIVIDSIGRKIYWTDGDRNSIEASELDGSNRKVLVWTGLDAPRAIALYYEHGYIFWSDWGKVAKIERADMDGKNRRIIVDKTIKWPNGLAIDHVEGRLYWNDAKLLTIESSDLDGGDRRTVLSNVPYPYGIVIVAQHIYWTDWKTKSLHRADKNGKNMIVLRSNLDGLMDLRVVLPDTPMDNACGSNNGGCSHLCLRSPKGYSCACPTGTDFVNKTDPNPKICKKHPDNFLLYATKSSLTMISLDSPEHWDTTLRLKGVQNSIALDYHWDAKLFFYTDVDLDVIRSINMLNLSDTRIVAKKNIDTPNGIGIDWIANNVYWTDNDNKVLEVARLDGSSRKVVIRGLEEPRSMALFPQLGYLYWTDWGESPSIQRCLLDGSNIQIIVQQDLGFPNGITIDYMEKRLYWTDALNDRIDTSGLHGEHRVQLVPEARNPFGMTQFKDHIYWTDWYRRSVMRADKKTGKNMSIVREGLETVMEIKVVTEERQRGWNPCKENNGGCSHLCLFVGNDYICACPDEADGRVCSITPKTKVGLKLPSQYYDYSDLAENNGNSFPMSTAEPPTANITTPLVITCVTVFLIVIAALFICVCTVKKFKGPIITYKEDYPDARRQFSFQNPNYAGSGTSSEPDRRTNRFQGIFKYDKSQQRVTNVYIPEGTSLLPLPPPPPPLPPPNRPLPALPTSHDDFEPVMIHAYP